MVTRNCKAPTSAQVDDFATREKGYKIVRIGTSGRGLYSALAGLFGSDGAKEATAYEYKPDMVTTDKSGKGLFFYLDKAYALEEAAKMAGKVGDRKLAVYYCKPIGDVTIPAGKSKTAVAPALILLDKVADVAKPKVWKKANIHEVTFDNCGCYMEFYYKGTRVAYLNQDSGVLTAANGIKDLKVSVNKCHITSIEELVDA
jgi:hypothetical protein